MAIVKAPPVSQPVTYQEVVQTQVSTPQADPRETYNQQVKKYNFAIDLAMRLAERQAKKNPGYYSSSDMRRIELAFKDAGLSKLAGREYYKSLIDNFASRDEIASQAKEDYYKKIESELSAGIRQTEQFPTSKQIIVPATPVPSPIPEKFTGQYPTTPVPVSTTDKFLDKINLTPVGPYDVSARDVKNLIISKYPQISKPYGVVSKAAKQIYNEPVGIGVFGMPGSVITLRQIKEKVTGVFPRSKYALELIPETIGGTALTFGFLKGGSYLYSKAPILTQTAFTGLAAGSRFFAETPEEKARANLALALSLTPIAAKGLKFAFSKPAPVRVKAGEIIKVNGKSFKYNPNEDIAFLSKAKYVTINGKQYVAGQLELQQRIPAPYLRQAPSRFGTLIGKEPTFKLGAKGKLIVLNSKDTVLLNEAGEIVGVLSKDKFIKRPPLFVARKVGSKTLRPGFLTAGSREVSLKDFKTFPKELQQQILTAYEQQTGRVLSPELFAMKFADSKLKFSVSDVRGYALGKFTIGGKSKPVKLGQGLTRTEIFDEAKLLLPDDATGISRYKIDSSFRDITFPKFRGRPTKIRTMRGISEISLNPPTDLTPQTTRPNLAKVKYYTGTPKENVENILVEGLKPKEVFTSQGGFGGKNVHLTTNIRFAERYTKGKGTVFEVKLTPQQKQSLKPIPGLRDAYDLKGSIPKEQLTPVKEAGNVLVQTEKPKPIPPKVLKTLQESRGILATSLFPTTRAYAPTPKIKIDSSQSLGLALAPGLLLRERTTQVSQTQQQQNQLLGTRSISAFNEVLTTRTAQREIQQPRFIQRSAQTFRQFRQLTNITTRTKTPTRPGIPLIPRTPTRPTPIFPGISFRKKKKPTDIFGFEITQRRKPRRFVRTPTITQQIFNLRGRAKPLSRLTGFETITL